jgi:hypothetical protein
MLERGWLPRSELKAGPCRVDQSVSSVNIMAATDGTANKNIPTVLVKYVTVSRPSPTPTDGNAQDSSMIILSSVLWLHPICHLGSSVHLGLKLCSLGCQPEWIFRMPVT